MSASRNAPDPRESLEELLAAGKVKSALILKGDWTEREAKIAHDAYAAGLESAADRLAAQQPVIDAARVQPIPADHRCDRWGEGTCDDPERLAEWGGVRCSVCFTRFVLQTLAAAPPEATPSNECLKREQTGDR